MVQQLSPAVIEFGHIPRHEHTVLEALEMGHGFEHMGVVEFQMRDGRAGETAGRQQTVIITAQGFGQGIGRRKPLKGRGLFGGPKCVVARAAIAQPGPECRHKPRGGIAQGKTHLCVRILPQRAFQRGLVTQPDVTYLTRILVGSQKILNAVSTGFADVNKFMHDRHVSPRNRCGRGQPAMRRLEPCVGLATLAQAVQHKMPHGIKPDSAPRDQTARGHLNFRIPPMEARPKT